MSPVRQIQAAVLIVAAPRVDLELRRLPTESAGKEGEQWRLETKRFPFLGEVDLLLVLPVPVQTPHPQLIMRS